MALSAKVDGTPDFSNTFFTEPLHTVLIEH